MDTTDNLSSKDIPYALNGKVLLCAGVVLFVALLILFCFHSYARVFFRNRLRRNLRRRAQHLLSISSTATPAIEASKGLDPSVIEKIPTFIYSAKASHCSSLECAVCLSELENDEKARLLPKCNHIFHVDCIDMWLNSHSNCPLCRAPVQAGIPVNSPKTFEQTVIPEAEVASSEPRGEDHIEMNTSSATGPSSSSSSTSPSLLKLESCPMKRMELMGVEIIVEVPTGEDRLTSVVADDVGSDDRTRGLKRIWGI